MRLTPEEATTLAARFRSEAISVRLLFIDASWHCASEVKGRDPTGLGSYVARHGLDGMPRLRLETERRQDRTVWYRDPAARPATVAGIIAAAAKAWRPPPRRTYRCAACGLGLPAYMFRVYPGGQHAPACWDCEPAHRRDVARREAAREGRVYMPRDERLARAQARLEERARRREERARNATDPAHQQALVKARKLKRKRAIAGAYVEPVNRELVAERERWRCGICGKKVTRKTWSLDHIVPLSAGGEHSYRNCTLAHRKCNTARGTGRLPVQAPLLAQPMPRPPSGGAPPIGVGSPGPGGPAGRRRPEIAAATGDFQC